MYIDDIDNIAPCYLYEEYNCSIPYPPEDGMRTQGKCKVKVKFAPYGHSRSTKSAKSGKNGQKDDSESLPGLKVLYSQEVITDFL